MTVEADLERLLDDQLVGLPARAARRRRPGGRAPARCGRDPLARRLRNRGVARASTCRSDTPLHVRGRQPHAGRGSAGPEGPADVRKLSGGLRLWDQKSSMPPPGMAGALSSGLSAMTASVVRNSAAIDAAFCSADRVTFVASGTPAFSRSSYSPVAALRPFAPSRFLHLLDDHAALEAGVDGDLLERLLDGLGDDLRPGRLVTVELLGCRRGSPTASGAAPRRRRGRCPPRPQPSWSRRRPRCGASSPSAPPRWRHRP